MRTELDTEDESRRKGFGQVRVAVNGRVVGWRSLGKSTIALQRCPKCDLENYCMCVLSGQCYACGYDINKEPNDDQD